MVQTVAMGFDVHVVVALRALPTETLLAALDHQFELVEHEARSKSVTITERVSVAEESDAVEFVRALVLDAVPDGSKISGISAEAG
jgi:hypothetical protein